MKKSNLQAFLLVFSTVILGLISAWWLKEAADSQDVSLLALSLVIGIVLVVNFARFLIWGYVHKRYPISFSYPLNSMFFPSILVMAYFYGEPVNINQVLGVGLITAGVAVLAYQGRNS